MFLYSSRSILCIFNTWIHMHTFPPILDTLLWILLFLLDSFYILLEIFPYRSIQNFFTLQSGLLEGCMVIYLIRPHWLFLISCYYAYAYGKLVGPVVGVLGSHGPGLIAFTGAVWLPALELPQGLWEVRGLSAALAVPLSGTTPP